jgi:predicted SAM-dependent methyltransferase
VSVRDFLKQSEAVVGAVRDCRRLLATFRAAERNSADVSRRYLASAAVKKLQIGSGPTLIPGWLSSDIKPMYRETIYLDASKPFPFPDATFDYVFAEHMIEHVSWRHGLSMLKECHRVLKPTGAVRLATPDLSVLAGLLRSQDARAARYIAWVTDNFLPEAPGRFPGFVLNCTVNGFGHRFVYDEETLALTMRLAGFASITRHAIGESEDPQLRGLEAHTSGLTGDPRLNREMVVFETMVLEGRP